MCVGGGGYYALAKSMSKRRVRVAVVYREYISTAIEKYYGEG